MWRRARGRPHEAPAASGATAAPAVAAGEPVTLRLMTAASGPAGPWENLIAGFEAANPNITVEFEALPQEQYNSTLTTQLNSGNGPDLFTTTSGAVETAGATRLGQAGLLLDLSDQPWASRVDKALWGGWGRRQAAKAGTCPSWSRCLRPVLTRRSRAAPCIATSKKQATYGLPLSV